jgi:hypothetical protein
MENRFFVPTHQRDYRWDEDKVRKLLDDITEAMERDDKFYFIGLMVFMKSSDDRLRVLDGQQRLATIIILFSAIRAWFAITDGATTNTASSIQRDFIGKDDYGNPKMEPKLSLNLNNDERFQKYVIDGSPLTEIRRERITLSKNAPNAALIDAINYVHGWVTQLSESQSTEETRSYLIKLILFLKNSIVAVRLTVPSEANAFRVFETLNDRGLDLSASDLLKNYLFGLAYDVSPDFLQQIEYRWSQLTHELNDVSEADFLKVFWTSRYGRTQLDGIFDDARRRVKNGDQAISLSVDLLEAAEQYVALDSPDDPVWVPYSMKTRDRIRGLKLLGAKQLRPVMLSALKRFVPSEMERLVYLLESIIVRYQVIGGGRTGVLEIQSAKLAEAIWSKSVRTAADARTAVSVVCPNDAEFQSAFAEKDGVTNQKAAYMLKEIENSVRRDEMAADATTLEPGRALTLEHIMPKGGGPAWKDEIQADPSLLEDCALRLGNLCLLTEGRNREAERRSFSEKRRIYEVSELRTTRRVAAAENWGREGIRRHQMWLASKAVQVWRIR